MRDRVAIIVGAGDAIGSAITRKFAARGLTVCALRRNGDKLNPLIDDLTGQGCKAYGYSCDARKEEQVVERFAAIDRDIGDIEVVVFNIGANVPMGILDTDSRKFFKIWEMACYAGFLAGREAARYMTGYGQGTILFTGATASARGAAGFAAFASAKHGLRALAQSMARELGPQNIHVAHIIIDAAVDTQWIMTNFPDAQPLKERDGVVAPEDLATNYVMLYDQPRNAWTFELDLRPWIEKW